MFKLTKKADYGLIAMKHLAERAQVGACCSAKDLAEAYGLPQEALAKILQLLARAKLVATQRGTNGGYMLARDAREITAFQVIQAIEGPLFLTSCVSVRGRCDQSGSCTVREPLQRISRSIEAVLARITVSELVQDSPATSATLAKASAAGSAGTSGAQVSALIGITNRMES
jgi:FeS assembly SUF system regulator